MKRVVFPTSAFISPGIHTIQVETSVEKENWWMGHFIDSTIDKSIEMVEIEIPDHPRETFTFLDKTFTIIRDSDEDFWGEGGKAVWFENLKETNRLRIAQLAAQFGWELDSNGNPLPLPVIFSKSKLESENKTLMAHVVAEMGIFPSVGQARKNGWDKPLELGDFSATKKKIRFRIVE